MIAGCYTRRFCGMSTAPGPPEASPALSLHALRPFSDRLDSGMPIITAIQIIARFGFGLMASAGCAI